MMQIKKERFSMKIGILLHDNNVKVKQDYMIHNFLTFFGFSVLILS